MKETTWDSIRVLFTILDPNDYFGFYRISNLKNTMVIEAQHFTTYDIRPDTEHFEIETERYNLPLNDVPFFSAIFRPDFMNFGNWSPQFDEIDEIECIGPISAQVLVSEISEQLNGLSREQLVKLLTCIRLNGELVIEREDFLGLKSRILEPHSEITTVTGPFGVAGHQIDGIQIGINQLPPSTRHIDMNRFCIAWLTNRFSDSEQAAHFVQGDPITEIVPIRPPLHDEDDGEFEVYETGFFEPGLLAHFTIASRWLYVEFEEKVDIDSWFDEFGPQYALIHEGWIPRIQVAQPNELPGITYVSDSATGNSHPGAVEWRFFRELINQI